MRQYLDLLSHVLDYGTDRSGAGDTLQAIRDGGFAPPLERPGAADLTAHVDFPRLAAVARAHGAAVHGPISQGRLLSALGLFPEAPLDPAHPNPQRSWVASKLTPFSARMVTEKLSCRRGGKNREYVRILVNDVEQPLEFCGRGDGLCEVGAFVESQVYARNDGEGDWEKCFAA